MEDYVEEIISFVEEFKEERCRDYLFARRWPKGFRCPKCNHDEKWDLNAIKYKCKKCRHQTSLYIGTIFEKTHQPLASWFLAIKYVTIDPKRVTASELQELTKLKSNNTALKWWHTFKKVALDSEQYRHNGKITFDELMDYVVGPAVMYEDDIIEEMYIDDDEYGWEKAMRE